MKLSIGILFAAFQALVAASPLSNPLTSREECSPLESEKGMAENGRCWTVCDGDISDGRWCWAYDSMDPANDDFAHGGDKPTGCAAFSDCFPADQQDEREMLRCGC